MLDTLEMEPLVQVFLLSCILAVVFFYYLWSNIIGYISITCEPVMNCMTTNVACLINDINTLIPSLLRAGVGLFTSVIGPSKLLHLDSSNVVNDCCLCLFKSQGYDCEFYNWS